MKSMNNHPLQPPNVQAPRSSLLKLVIISAFIAMVAFCAPAGVLAVIFTRPLFALTTGVVCPPGSEMQFEEWEEEGDWEEEASTQFRAYSVDSSGQQVQERTLQALAVLMCSFFLAGFFIVLAVLLIVRAVRHRNRSTNP